MRLTRDMLKALDMLTEQSNTDRVDVSHVNKTGGSGFVRVAVVNGVSRNVRRHLMDEHGGLHPYA